MNQVHDEEPNSGPPALAPCFQLGHRPSLDGFRGLAVLAVMSQHFLDALGFRSSPSTGGFLGVDMFFVLSGLLITTLLLEERQSRGIVSLRQFYVRRALRLLPALVVLLVAATILGSVLPLGAVRAPSSPDAPLNDRWTGVLVVLGFVANWAIILSPLRDSSPGIVDLSHTWSLSVEEQFYLVWPPLLIWLCGRGIDRGRLLGLVGLGIVGAWLLKALLWHAGEGFWRVYAGSDTRADSLLVGCALGILATENCLPTKGLGRRFLQLGSVVAGLFLAAAIVAIPYVDRRFLYYGGFTAVAVSAAFVLAAVLVSPVSRMSRLLGSGWLVWVGRLSYGFYLWHIFLLAYCVDHFGPGPLSAGLGAVLTLVVVPLCYYLVERPFLRLKPRGGRPAVRRPGLMRAVT
jgi:peptidoglycan/LPS O-acetylase OafA/YrhL